MQSQQRRTRRQEVRALEDAGHLASALIAVDALLGTDPSDAHALLIRGRLLVSLGRYVEAESVLSRARSLIDAEAEYAVHRELGHLYEASGRFDLALSAFHKVAELCPSHAAGHVSAGAMLARLGRFDESAACLERGADCSEGRVEEAHFTLGALLRAQERFDDAKRCFERALELDPLYRDAKVALDDVTHALEVRAHPGS